MHFASSVLFCNEETFSREGVFNTHNAYMGALSNPHDTRPRAAQQHFTFNMLASTMVDNLLGLYILLIRLDSDKYIIFIRQFFRNCLPMSPHLCGAHVVSIGWSAFHYGGSLRNYLDQTFLNRWIRRGSHIVWPPKSPDLSHLNCFPWGVIKSLA
ncbi:DDE_3 domain-containing protein [Trichonephila clavata]|uniref:DDE_3 domain-containing protein n=1 Tax=Trichonephila clavata TaxID=2740835 RepID=A0A8X6J8Q5_TRICU|nr:DDE_3 domain-containing protein [Trichonephila clavata]